MTGAKTRKRHKALCFLYPFRSHIGLLFPEINPEATKLSAKKKESKMDLTQWLQGREGVQTNERLSACLFHCHET